MLIAKSNRARERQSMSQKTPPNSDPSAEPENKEHAGEDEAIDMAEIADEEIRAEARDMARKRAESKRLVAPPKVIPVPSKPRFSQPVRQMVMMLVVLALVVSGGTLAYARIWPIFSANPWLNGFILGVFVIGVLASFWQLGQLARSVDWIEGFAERHHAAVENGIAAASEQSTRDAPRLLAPLAVLLGTRSSSGAISASAAGGILESVATRIEEGRDITRYIANLLIFLGLLGTFYGLATTVPAVVETIRALAPKPDESAMQLFDKLMSGLESQLGGMATAFSSSLLGLAGSLVVGMLELFATHGQNRFYRELEEWMTSFTNIGMNEDAREPAGTPDLAAFTARLDQQLTSLHEFYAERDALSEMDQLAADERALLMARSVRQMNEAAIRDMAAFRHHSEGIHKLTARLTDGQDRLIALTEIAAEDRLSSASDQAGLTDEVRSRLRSLDFQITRLADHNTSTRIALHEELREEIANLTRAVERLGRDDISENGGGSWR